ncbi:hypothetical protein RCO48_16300 [Peribacillus frigoritolerans]|nr:hypothetical protein [Peribacillus frigoritolerans]
MEQAGVRDCCRKKGVKGETKGGKRVPEKEINVQIVQTCKKL